MELGEIAQMSLFCHLAYVRALVAVFIEKLAGVKNSILKIGQMRNVILVEELFVDHYGNETSSVGMSDDLIHLIHYPIIGLEIENKVYSSEKNVLVCVVP